MRNKKGQVPPNNALLDKNGEGKTWIWVNPKISKINQLKRPRRPSYRVLDALMSQVVRRQAGGKCWICRKKGSQAAHIFSKKAFPKSRYELENVRWACFACHKGSKYSMHENPVWFQDWYRKEEGAQGWENLKKSVYLREAASQKFDPIMTKIILGKMLETKKIGEVPF